MGSRWTPSGPNEVGIDGYIELFDPHTREPLGRTLAVQSKAVSEFANDTEETCDYWCTRADIHYWMRGNTAVVLVLSRPTSGEAYWVSIKDYFGAGEVGSPRIRFSKRSNRFSLESLPQLLDIATSSSHVLYLAPAPKEERLHSNLLPLIRFPEKVYTARSDCRFAKDVWSLLSGAGDGVDGAWILREGMMLAFHDLGEEPWFLVCDPGTVEAIETSYWADSNDPDRLRTFVQLLNRTLRSQVFGAVRYWPQEDCYAFTASADKPLRRWTYQSAKQKSTITVVQRYVHTAGDRKYQWLRHLAFRGQFRVFEREWYLEITPTYRFTHDGQALDRFHSERLAGIKRLEGNRAVLSALLLWSDFLRRPVDLFDQRSPVLGFGELVTAEIDVGLADAAWLSADETATRSNQADPVDLLYLPFPERDED